MDNEKRRTSPAFRSLDSGASWAKSQVLWLMIFLHFCPSRSTFHLFYLFYRCVVNSSWCILKSDCGWRHDNQPTTRSLLLITFRYVFFSPIIRPDTREVMAAIQMCCSFRHVKVVFFSSSGFFMHAALCLFYVRERGMLMCHFAFR